MTLHVRGLILCALGASLWGISGIAGQYLLQDKSFSPGQLTAIRMFGAGILLMVALIIRRDGRIRLVAPSADKHNWPGFLSGQPWGWRERSLPISKPSASVMHQRPPFWNICCPLWW